MNMFIKVAVAGLGFVGSSMVKSFQLKNYTVNTDLFCYDKFKDDGVGGINLLLLADVVFLALPTKYNEKDGSYDKSAISEVCTYLEMKNYTGAVVIKSTVEPETTVDLSNVFKLNFIHNPEFLTARTAFEDFHNQKHVVLGSAPNCSTNAFNLVENFYRQNYPEADISLCTSTESESMKSFVNCFYAVKVQFFNELYLTCKSSNTDYDKVRTLMLKNGWINEMHTNVPGPDGQLSYGGLCFPKDTNALLKHMENDDIPHAVLKAVITERNSMRDDDNNIIKN